MQRYDYLKVRAYKKDDYDEIRDFHDGFARVKKNNQWLFIDKNGQELEFKRLKR